MFEVTELRGVLDFVGMWFVRKFESEKIAQSRYVEFSIIDKAFIIA